MIISYSKNFIFVHLEKCGGTSVEMALGQTLEPQDIIMGSTPFGTAVQLAYTKHYGFNKIKNDFLWKHSSAQDIKKYLDKKQWNRMYKFATVRNPVSLMISFYFYSKKIIEQFALDMNIDNIEEYFLNEEYPKHWGAERFLYFYLLSRVNNYGINFFIQQMIEDANKAVSSQSSRLLPDVNLFDISNIYNDWPNIMKQIGIKREIEIGQANKSEWDEDFSLSQETLQKIYQNFAQDYEEIPRQTGINWV